MQVKFTKPQALNVPEGVLFATVFFVSAVKDETQPGVNILGDIVGGGQFKAHLSPRVEEGALEPTEEQAERYLRKLAWFEACMPEEYVPVLTDDLGEIDFVEISREVGSSISSFVKGLKEDKKPRLRIKVRGQLNGEWLNIRNFLPLGQEKPEQSDESTSDVEVEEA